MMMISPSKRHANTAGTNQAGTASQTAAQGASAAVAQAGSAAALETVQPHAAKGAGSRLGRTIRQRPGLSILVAAIVLGVAVGGGAAALASSGGSAAAPAGAAAAATNSTSGGGPAAASIPITASSVLAPETGDVYVQYQGGSNATARVSGDISDATSGEVARLYAQQFPFASASAPIASLTLDPTGTTAQYAFQVTPTLATKYEVELFRNGSATTPVATSSTTTIYVVRTKTSQKSGCGGGSVCQEVVTNTVFAPPSALSTEMAKHWYAYFAVNLSASDSEPAAPQTLQLGAGDPVVGQPQRISDDEFQVTVTYTFPVNGESYEAAWRECWQDTESEDGFGLPGSHGCGNTSAPATGGYLG